MGKSPDAFDRLVTTITFTGALAGTNVVQTTIDATNIQSVPPKNEVEATDVQGAAAGGMP